MGTYILEACERYQGELLRALTADQFMAAGTHEARQLDAFLVRAEGGSGGVVLMLAEGYDKFGSKVAAEIEHGVRFVALGYLRPWNGFLKVVKLDLPMQPCVSNSCLEVQKTQIPCSQRL